MIHKAEKIITEYSLKIKPNFPHYAAIYTSFIEYLKETKENYDGSFYDYFENEFSKNDIIQSCVRYVRNSNKATSLTAIERYLNAMTKLYEECIQKEGCNNRNLFAILPFGNLKTIVNDKIKDLKLKEKSSIPPIDDNTANIIIKFLQDKKNTKSDVSKRNSIMLRLIMLYGFKLERLKYIKVSDLRCDNHILDINSEKYGDNILSLELPFSLVSDINKYIEFLQTDTNFRNDQYLFLMSTGKLITSSCCKEIFDKLNTNKNCSRITLVGICKYAIINMIEHGLSKEKIKLITGVQDDIIDDCEEIYLRRLCNNTEKEFLNREINQKIRSLPIYDDINAL